MYIYILMCFCVCIYVCTHIYINVYVFIYPYMYEYMCVYIRGTFSHIRFLALTLALSLSISLSRSFSVSLCPSLCPPKRTHVTTRHQHGVQIAHMCIVRTINCARNPCPTCGVGSSRSVTFGPHGAQLQRAYLLAESKSERARIRSASFAS